MTKSKIRAAFTLIEMTVGIGCLTLVGSLCYYLLTAGTTLYAKGWSINVSNLGLRYSLDRMNSELREATTTPELINLITAAGSTNGNIVSNASSPSAGVRFDKYLGEHYVVVNPGGTGGTGLAGATSFQVQFSTNSFASPPTPQVNDVLLLNGCSTRAVVSACTVVSSSNSVETVSVTVSPAVTISWLYPSVESAILVHQEAFVVQGNTLYFYPSVENVTNVNNTSNILLSNNISSTGPTPFSTGTGTYLSVNLIVSSQQYSAYLSNKQSVGQYNNFLALPTILQPRNSIEVSSP